MTLVRYTGQLIAVRPLVKGVVELELARTEGAMAARFGIIYCTDVHCVFICLVWSIVLH